MRIRLVTQAARPRPFRKRFRDNRGVELFEFALIFPILFSLLIGMFWMGRAFNVYQTITRAAREGARFAVAPSCGSCGNSFPTDADVTTVINYSLTAVSMDPTKVNPAISIQRNQVLNPSDPTLNQVQGVVVSFGYPVSLVIPFTSVSATTITIKTQVQMRQEL